MNNYKVISSRKIIVPIKNMLSFKILSRKDKQKKCSFRHRLKCDYLHRLNVNDTHSDSGANSDSLCVT